MERLAETARQVYDPAFDEETTASPLDQENIKIYRSPKQRYARPQNRAEESESEDDEDCETVYPEDVDALTEDGSDSDSDFARSSQSSAYDSASPYGARRPVAEGQDLPYSGERELDRPRPLYGSVPPGIRAQQVRHKQRYTADDFLAEPTNSEKIGGQNSADSVPGNHAQAGFHNSKVFQWDLCTNFDSLAVLVYFV